MVERPAIDESEFEYSTVLCLPSCMVVARSVDYGLIALGPTREAAAEKLVEEIRGMQQRIDAAFN